MNNWHNGDRKKIKLGQNYIYWHNSDRN